MHLNLKDEGGSLSLLVQKGYQDIFIKGNESSFVLVIEVL